MASHIFSFILPPCEETTKFPHILLNEEVKGREREMKSQRKREKKEG
jgi:hypothetical protein